ncbi:MAG: rRNA pseudouridine synthase [Spirochaetales bacterium]|nr:rRNA pseudouridine synthase [Spirochaetales bacterium]
MKQKVTDSNLPVEAEEGIRLQVYLAHSGVASRRACEQIIKDGRVTVNGVIVTQMGVRVLPSDVILLDNTPIFPEEEKRYVLLNKPSGFISSLSDDRGRPVAADLIKERYKERLYNIGRLDMYSAGALLFTNDGEFSAIVGHPSAEIEKEYIVEASMPFKDELLESFTKGIRLDSVFYKARSTERLSSRRLKVVLIEGKNREIRRVLEHFGVRVKSLIRIRIGPVSLGDLPRGSMRDLTKAEIAALYACKQEDRP